MLILIVMFLASVIIVASHVPGYTCDTVAMVAMIFACCVLLVVVSDAGPSSKLAFVAQRTFLMLVSAYIGGYVGLLLGYGAPKIYTVRAD